MCTILQQHLYNNTCSYWLTGYPIGRVSVIVQPSNSLAKGSTAVLTCSAEGSDVVFDWSKTGGTIPSRATKGDNTLT